MQRLAEGYGADNRGLSLNDIADILAKEMTGLDVRLFSGSADISEVIPYGGIMAGDWQKNARGGESAGDDSLCEAFRHTTRPGGPPAGSARAATARDPIREIAAARVIPGGDRDQKL